MKLILAIITFALAACAPTVTVTETLRDGTVRVTKTEGGIDPATAPLVEVVAGTYAIIHPDK